MHAAVQALGKGRNSPGGLVGVHSRRSTTAERAAHPAFKSSPASSLTTHPLVSSVIMPSLESHRRLLTGRGTPTKLLGAVRSTATRALVTKPSSCFSKTRWSRPQQEPNSNEHNYTLDGCVVGRHKLPEAEALQAQRVPSAVICWPASSAFALAHQPAQADRTILEMPCRLLPGLVWTAS